ncbi:hypothetical protein NDU88_000476 [Pleurodeles waltl]|uniref:Uncharacterized protein n=1 Tax=Pleurodeles waltl TaxID=8319 RepID=A0AAV7VW76_PLEWA|nr:hypothetical protein NDU88_000476 [Pleurodeles waltl]
MRSPDPLQEVLPQASRLKELFVVRKRGAGRCSRRSRVSLARRVAVGGRGVGPIGSVAVVRQKGAQRVAAHAPDSACSSISFTQAQPPRKSGIEPHAALLDEKELGDAFKMAAPSEGIFPLPRTLEEGQLDASVKMAVRSEFVGEDVIIISDEETERQDRLRLVEGDNNLLPFGQLGGRVSRCVRGMHSLDSDLCREVRDGNFGSQSVFKVGEQVEFVDQAGVVIRGMVCGQTSGDGSIGRAQVLMDFWRAGLDEGNPGYDAHRFSGGLSEVMVHREAGRPAGGQSASVKVRAPLGHRREGRVKSGAVYPTARESVLSGSLGHGAGSVLDEQPSTSRGASARFESTEEEWLDYEEDVEEQVMPALKSVAKGATQSVSEVVRGDRSGNRHLDVAVSNLPRGEELDGGSENFGFGRQVVLGARMEHVWFGLAGIPLFAGLKNRQLRGILVANWVWVTASTGQGGSRVVEIGSCDEIYGEEFDLGTVAGRHARLCGVIAPPPGAVRTRQRGVLGRPAVVGFEQATEDCTTHCLGYSEIVVRRRKPSISLTPTIVIFTEPRGCAQSAALMHHPPS